jgi:hypothetical protein
MRNASSASRAERWFNAFMAEVREGVLRTYTQCDRDGQIRGRVVARGNPR